MTATPRVLFLTSNTEDYLADSLFHGLREVNCLSYPDANELLRVTESPDAARYAGLQADALEWARASSTRRRAEALLAELGFG